MVASPRIPANLPILYTPFPRCDRPSISTIASKMLLLTRDFMPSNSKRRTFASPSLSPNDSAYQWSVRLFFTALIDHKAFRHHMLGFGQLGVAIVMNSSQRFAFFYALADAFVK